jgi:signal transduction histidine kinase
MELMNVVGHPAPAGQDEAPDRAWRALMRRLAAPGSVVPVGIGIGVSGLIPNRGIRAVISLAGLGASLWYITAATPLGLTGAALAALVSVVIAGLGWLLWLTADVTGTGRPALAAVWVAMAAAGGVLATSGPAGLIFVGVAAGGAAIAFELPVAVALAAAGPAGFVVAAAVRDALPGRLLSVAVVSLAALVSGTGRRQMAQRARQQTLIATARERADVVRREAELVSERNRLGRELHDVLAHTLGALSIQLTALDTQVQTGVGRDELRTEIQRSHQLVGEGLDEARQAVRALRDDHAPLDGQLQRLADQHGASFEVSGTPRPLRAEPSLTLYRVTQEALTNAAKHAPDAPVTARLSFDDQAVTLTVHNDLPDPVRSHPLSGSGGGYGLLGMKERVQQAGGTCETGPAGDGWQVTVSIPADRP